MITYNSLARNVKYFTPEKLTFLNKQNSIELKQIGKNGTANTERTYFTECRPS
jgi:hypothetical protein